jgi:hypothetical protein
MFSEFNINRLRHELAGAVLRWGVRLGALYLAAWWGLLYLSFSAAVASKPLPLGHYFMAMLLGVVHLPLWLMTLRLTRRWKKILLLPICITLTGYFYIASDKLFYLPVLAICIYGIVLIHFFIERNKHL